jgi:beta-lactamase superfamily II metal-dependent hydrolase
MLISSVVSLKCDLLKVGHHGSNTATSQTFLDVVDPEYAVICAGIDNTYGHPHNETIQKLTAKGVDIYGTYASGTIIASTNGTTITFNTEPIPETISPLALTMLAAAILLAITVYKRKNVK